MCCLELSISEAFRIMNFCHKKLVQCRTGGLRVTADLLIGDCLTNFRFGVITHMRPAG